MQNLLSLRKELKSKSNPQKAKILRGFFKTGKGEYGEGDMFLGLTSAQIKEIALKFKDLSFKEIQELLKSKIHEERAAALRILVNKYQSASINGSKGNKNKFALASAGALTRQSARLQLSGQKNRPAFASAGALTRQSARSQSSGRKSGQGKKDICNTITRDSITMRDSRQNRSDIFNFYLKNTKYINNWDLVDMSAPKIVGDYLLNSASIDGSRQILYKLAKSKNLWERRIAIISTYAFIRQNKFEDTLKISKMFLNDKQDLIHKAVGWMLREVGKRSQITLEKFLKANYKNMPRTMLRYAIEKFPEKKRKGYLNG